MKPLFYANIISYWLICFSGSLYHDHLLYDLLYNYGREISIFQLFFAAILLNQSSSRARSCFSFMAIHFFYSSIADILFGEVTAAYYMTETFIFFMLANWILLRPYFSTGYVNRDNVLFAFYKGDKGSLLMSFGEIFGLPVKSMCIIAGDSCLRLKAKRNTFCISENGKSIVASDDYVVFDTGKPISEKYVSKLKNFDIMPAKRFFSFRANCIKGILPLLSELDKKFIPQNKLELIPSFYLRKCLNLKGSLNG